MRLFNLLLLSLFFCSAHAQSDEAAYRLDSLLFDRADRMGQAFIQGKYEHFADYTYPTILARLGGKDSMVMMLQNSMRQNEEAGLEFTSVSFGQHSDFVQTPTEMQCVLPQELKMSVRGGSMTVISHLVAITQDEGVTWYFLDSTDQTLEELQRVVPTLSNDLVIPKNEKPIFTKE